MSRLDQKVAEQNRIAFQESQKQTAQKIAVAKWLKDNPEIGELNGGRYYKISGSKVIYLKALTNDILSIEDF